MSNGTRKKVVNFKKLLVNVEENLPIRKNVSKQNYSNQNNSQKKDKNIKNMKNKKDNQAKAPEKPSSKKQKTRNCKKKEQLSLFEYTNKLNEYQEELTFLQKKRNSDINIEKILSFQKRNQNKYNTAFNNNDNNTKNNNSKNKKIEDINNNVINNNKNINIINNLQNKNTKTEIDNENSTLIIDFYKLYYHLFDSNRLDNSKPYKFVDYLITGDNLLFNLKKDKLRFEEIKKGMSIKPKNNSSINEQLLYKYLYEYLKCDFSNSFMKKAVEKINMFLMNRYINKRKEKNSVENSITIDKKDKFTYSNFLADKLKDNINKSTLSFTNDTDYFKSLIYICNKYSKYIGKKEVPEKILIESLEKNKKILEDFKNLDEEEGIEAKKIEKEYLKDLLHSKTIRKYISKKLRSFNDDILENNKILTSLDKNQFYKIMSIIIKNKNDDDNDKLYKLFDEGLSLNDNNKLDNNDNNKLDKNENNKLDKNDLKNFIVIIKFLLELILTNKLNNNINNLNYIDENNIINYISLIREIYEKIIIIQKTDKQETNENDNEKNNPHKNKRRNRIKIKKIKEANSTNIKDKEENESLILDINNNKINNINNPNENNISNSSDKNSIKSNNTDSKPKKTNIKNSKIVPFKIPYSINNNYTNNINNNKINNGLFEINNKSEINNNSNMNQMKIDDTNRNSYIEKAHFETINEYKTENNDNTKEENKNKKRRKRNVDQNKENLNISTNDIYNNKNENVDNNLLNNCMTFYAMNQTTIKDLNLGRYILNKLSSGEDIFKLIIEKPKIKRPKEKEISENNSISKEKEKEKDNENNKENEKIKEKENNTNKRKRNIKDKNKNDNNIKIKKEDDKDTKIKEENIDIKEEIEEKEKEKENEIKIKKEDDKGIKKERDIEIKKEDHEENNVIKKAKIKKEIIHIKEEKKLIEDNLNNKESHYKKDIETRDNSSKSIENNNKNMNKFIKINKKNTNIFFNNKNIKEKERNIDVIHFNNSMTQEGGEPIKEITRNDLKHSPNISVKISQKTLNHSYKDNNKKNNELIFNINNNYNNKYLFATNKNSNGLETKSKIRKNKNENKSFKNMNIEIARQSVEIKNGNVILNDKRDINNDSFKLNDFYFNGF